MDTAITTSSMLNVPMASMPGRLIVYSLEPFDFLSVAVSGILLLNLLFVVQTLEGAAD
jgi:hypothetical protein